MTRRVTDQEIMEAFAKAEDAAGGPQQSDPKEVLRTVADELGVAYERVRSAVLWNWGLSG